MNQIIINLTTLFYNNKQYVIEQMIAFDPQIEQKIKGLPDKDILNLFLYMLSINKPFADKIQELYVNTYGIPKAVNQLRKSEYTDAPPLDDSSAPTTDEGGTTDWGGIISAAGGFVTIFGSLFAKPQGQQNAQLTAAQQLALLQQQQKDNEKNAKIKMYVAIGFGVVAVILVGSFMTYAIVKSNKKRKIYYGKY